MTDTPPELPPLPAHFDGESIYSSAEMRAYATEAVRCALAARPAAVAVEPPKPVAWCALTQSGQIAYFDGKPMVMPGPVGNDCHPTPLYAAAPPQDARDAALLDGIEKCEVRDGWVIAKNVGSFTAHFGRGQHATRKTLREAISAAMTKEQP